MTDKVNDDKRSWIMSRIKGKNTSLEIKVRKYLFHHGFRYRINVKDLPGTPDIFLKKYNTVIFVNGCFWHHHYHCRLGYIPKSNSQFWINKFNKNIENDIKHAKELVGLGYKVITVWECEIRDCFEYRMEELIKEITSDINQDE